MTPRDAFFKEIEKRLIQGADIYIVTPDFGSPVLDELKKSFKHRVINTGVAEQNAILVACGLSLIGKVVIVYGMSCFIVSRCYEQLKIDVDGMKIPLTIVGVGYDDEYGSAGYSHWAFEDRELISTLKNIELIEAHDQSLLPEIVERSLRREKPLYVKLHRK